MKYLIDKTDGSVGIMETFNGADPRKCVDKWAKEKSSMVVSINKIEDSEIPTDKYFRSAWTVVDGKIKEDMVKCREIHKNILRKCREKYLLALDAEYMKALEKNDSAAMKVIAEHKQKLRDITEHEDILNSKTPDELRASTFEKLMVKSQIALDRDLKIQITFNNS